MKKILLIATGGTIASVDNGNGLAPGLTGESLVAMIPEIRSLCSADCIELMKKDSTNIQPEDWQKMASTVMENYDAYDGFVITHGTDTMAYTAAGLSYIIQNNAKPIVLTGAQVSAMEKGSDGENNLRDAFICACDDSSCGVQIVFAGSVINGTRARKNFTKSFAAFGSINYPEIARIQSGRLIRFIPQKTEGSVRIYEHMDSNVGILKLTPGMSSDVMRFVVDHYDGLIVESFGVGGLPQYGEFYAQIKRAINLGKLVVMTTQVANEGSDLSVYQVGRVLKDQLPVLEAHDMTTEAAFAKLMWILGQTRDFEAAEKLFYTPINADILFS